MNLNYKVVDSDFEWNYTKYDNLKVEKVYKENISEVARQWFVEITADEDFWQYVKMELEFDPVVLDGQNFYATVHDWVSVEFMGDNQVSVKFRAIGPVNMFG